MKHASFFSLVASALSFPIGCGGAIAPTDHSPSDAGHAREYDPDGGPISSSFCDFGVGSACDTECAQDGMGCCEDWHVCTLTCIGGKWSYGSCADAAWPDAGPPDSGDADVVGDARDRDAHAEGGLDFPCGPSSCHFPDEYCEEFAVWPPPPPGSKTIGYKCSPTPAACANAPTCACVAKEQVCGGTVPVDCVESAGAPLVQCAYP